MYDIMCDVISSLILAFDQWLAWTTTRASCPAPSLGLCWDFCLFSRHQLAPTLTLIGRDSVVWIFFTGLWTQSSLKSTTCANSSSRDTIVGPTKWSRTSFLAHHQLGWIGDCCGWAELYRGMPHLRMSKGRAGQDWQAVSCQKYSRCSCWCREGACWAPEPWRNNQGLMHREGDVISYIISWMIS